VRALRAGAFALLALAPLPASAACDPEAPQSELDACTAAAYRAADRTLNALYAETKRRLKGEAGTAQLLTLSQRVWVGWRDAECDFAAASVAGGSVYPMVRSQCLTDLTTARVADFRRYLACEEGDLSCPLPPQ
jgi:uncharacterized protein YecT (DUF1311 family)